MKTVYKYDENKNLICTFKSAKEAADACGVKAIDIYSVCGKSHFHNKDYWLSYKEPERMKFVCLIRDNSAADIVPDNIYDLDIEYIEMETEKIHKFDKIKDAIADAETRGGKNAVKNLIYQYDMYGNVVSIYRSALDASISSGKSKATIENVCKSQRFTNDGFLFSNVQLSRKKIESILENLYDTKYAKKSVNRTQKLVYEYDIDGNTINVFSSIKEAALSCNVTASTVSDCCMGKIAICKNGLIFSYNESFDKVFEVRALGIKEYKDSRRTIFQYDYTGKLINIFDTMKEATTKTKLSVMGIYNSCLGINLSSCGFIFSYSKLTKAKISEMVAGKRHIYGYHERKTNPVYRYDFDGNIMKVFKSARIAALETGINERTIASYCAGNINMTKGYFFSKEKLSNEDVVDRIRNYAKRKAVFQYDLYGNFIAEYNSVKEASLANDIDAYCLSGYNNEAGKKVRGYIYTNKKLNNKVSA